MNPTATHDSYRECVQIFIGGACLHRAEMPSFPNPIKIQSMSAKRPPRLRSSGWRPIPHHSDRVSAMDDSSLLIICNHVALDICWYKTPSSLPLLPSSGKDVLAALSGTCCDASPCCRLHAHQNQNPQLQVSTLETPRTAFPKLAVWKL